MSVGEAEEVFGISVGETEEVFGMSVGETEEVLEMSVGETEEVFEMSVGGSHEMEDGVSSEHICISLINSQSTPIYTYIVGVQHIGSKDSMRLSWKLHEEHNKPGCPSHIPSLHCCSLLRGRIKISIYILQTLSS